jgi:hypothetical protein
MKDNRYAENVVLKKYNTIHFNGILTLQFFKSWFECNILNGSQICNKKRFLHEAIHDYSDNNLIMISSNNKDVASVSKEFGYRDDEFLKISDVGAYMFKYKNERAKQTEIKPIKIDQNGFAVSTLDNTIEELNKRSDELFYTLKYGKANS